MFSARRHSAAENKLEEDAKRSLHRVAVARAEKKPQEARIHLVTHKRPSSTKQDRHMYTRLNAIQARHIQTRRGTLRKGG